MIRRRGVRGRLVNFVAVVALSTSLAEPAVAGRVGALPVRELQESEALAAAPVNDDTPSVVPVAPARLLDTRPGEATIDGLGYRGALAYGQTVAVPVVGRADVPVDGVGAVTVNVTALTGPSATSFLTVWPTGSPRPLASSINPSGASPVANLVTSKLGPDGTISIFNGGSTAHVIVDIEAWHPATSDLKPIVPARLTDTRPNQHTIDGQGWNLPVVPGRSARVRVGGRGGVPESGAAAVILNVTAVGATDPTYLTVYATGQTQPVTSNLNPDGGDALARMIVTGLGSGGAIDIASAAGSVDVIVDVVGWFAIGGDFVATAPGRLLDTRASGRTIDGAGLKGALLAGSAVSVTVAGRGGIPAQGVGVVFVNITSDQSSAPTYLTAFQFGNAKPYSSNVNPSGPRPTSNLALVPVGLDGSITISNAAASTHLIVDVLGWFPLGTLVRGSLDLANGWAPGLLAEQKVRYSFERPIGTALSLVVTPQPVGGFGQRCGAVLRVFRPDGSLADESVSRGCDEFAAVEADLAINQTGRWTIEYLNQTHDRIYLPGAARLSQEVTLDGGTAIVDGATVMVPALAAGQNARWRFSPQLGSDIGVGMSPGFGIYSNSCDVRLLVRRPDGTTAGSDERPPCQVGVLWQLSVVFHADQAGVWSVEVDNSPANFRSAGSLTIARSIDAGQVSVPSMITVPDRPLGQAIRWSFDPAPGHELSLFVKLTAGNWWGTCTDLVIRRPDGTLYGSYKPCAELNRLDSNLDIDFTPDVGGRWSLTVSGPVQDGLRRGSLVLASTIDTAVPDSEAAMSLAGLLPGQNVRRTLTAKVGDQIGVGWTGLIQPGTLCVVKVRVLRPNGTEAGAHSCEPGALDRLDVPVDATGTWTAVLDTEAESTTTNALFGFSRRQELGTVQLNTPIAIASLTPGRSLRMSVVLQQGFMYGFGDPRSSWACAGEPSIIRPDGTPWARKCVPSGHFMPDMAGLWTFEIYMTPEWIRPEIVLWEAYDAGVLRPNTNYDKPVVPPGRPVIWHLPLKAGEPWLVQSPAIGNLMAYRPSGERAPVIDWMFYESPIDETLILVNELTTEPFSFYVDKVRLILAPSDDSAVAVDTLRPHQVVQIRRSLQIISPGRPVVVGENLITYRRNATPEGQFTERYWSPTLTWDGSILEIVNASDKTIPPFTVTFTPN